MRTIEVTNNGGYPTPPHILQEQRGLPEMFWRAAGVEFEDDLPVLETATERPIAVDA